MDVQKNGRVRAILFDKDGTLFDFRATWLPVFRDAAVRAAQGDAERADRLLLAAGYDAARDLFLPDGPIAAGTARDIARAWCGILPHRDPGELIREMDRYSAEMAPRQSVPVCDLPALMEELLRMGFALGVATSDSEAGARTVLQRFRVEQCFSWISGYDSGHGVKPDPAVLRNFAEAVGVKPGEVAMVGDTFHDMNLGRSAGAALVVGVCTGAVPAEVLRPEADIILDSIADLPRVLDQVTR